MKRYKSYLIFMTLLCTISLIIVTHQRSSIKKIRLDMENLEKENKKISILSKELKKTIDIKDKSIVLLKQELENNSSFSSTIFFNPNNITEPSGASYEQLLFALKGTKLSEHVNSFLLVEQTYNINALAMIGIVANESSWLKSDRTLRQNNVTGYAVYADTSEGASFSSIDECILKTAELLSKEYLSPQGRYYHGLSTSNVNTMYSSDADWHNIVTDIANQIKDEVNDMVKKIRS